VLRRAHVAGVVAGLALLPALAPLARVPAADRRPTAAVVVRAVPAPELDVPGDAVVLRAPALAPGGAGAEGTVRVRNLTARTLHLRVGARADVPDLDGVLELRVTAGGPLAEGPLGGLRAGRPLPLGPGAAATVAVRVRIPAEQGALAGGRAADVSLDLGVQGAAR
jgi:hypothetical protein